MEIRDEEERRQEEVPHVVVSPQILHPVLWVFCGTNLLGVEVLERWPDKLAELDGLVS
jgi:hypothetical protein